MQGGVFTLRLVEAEEHRETPKGEVGGCGWVLGGGGGD